MDNIFRVGVITVMDMFVYLQKKLLLFKNVLQKKK